MTPAAARKPGLEPCPACTPAAGAGRAEPPMFYVEIALLGIIFGCLYALSATGIVLTYTATGVFNIAHFAIALLAGYLGWQLSGVWGLPLVLVVPIVLLVCGPLMGLVLERVVFRPLQERRASSSEKLVAALGVTVVVLALINVHLGPGRAGHDRRARAAAVRGATRSRSARSGSTPSRSGLLCTVLVVAGAALRAVPADLPRHVDPGRRRPAGAGRARRPSTPTACRRWRGRSAARSPRSPG